MGTKARNKAGTMGDFLRKKLEFLFRYRYDVNSDGMINFEDYESVVKKLTSAVAVHKLWDVPAKLSGPAYDSLTNNGEKPLDFNHYLEISKRFFSTYDVKDNSRFFWGVY